MEVEKVVKYPETARVVKRAKAESRMGDEEFARIFLKRSPRTVAKYIQGEVRPKADTLLKCIELIGRHSPIGKTNINDDLKYLKEIVGRLNSENDRALIVALIGVIRASL